MKVQPSTYVRSAKTPPGRSRRAAFDHPTAGSTQWNAVAEKTASKVPSGSSTSSNRATWKCAAARYPEDAVAAPHVFTKVAVSGICVA
jgi:hypothetical protein